MSENGLRSWAELNAAAASLTQADLDGMGPIIEDAPVAFVCVAHLGVAAILRAGRRRYHGCCIVERPALMPTSLCGLFTAAEMIELGKAREWPLSPRRLARLIEAPADRARRRQRRERRIAQVVRETMAAELPEAVALLTKGTAT